jgi:hypothetical protein
MEHLPSDALVRLAAHALRNHLSSLVTLTHILEADGRSDLDVVAALQADLGRLALDAELLVDLARGSADRPTDSAPLDDLLREAIRPFAWLAEAGQSEVRLGRVPRREVSFLPPRQVVVVARRLIGTVLGAHAPTTVVLEGRFDGAVLRLQARCTGADQALARPEPDADADADPARLELAALHWALDLPDLRAQIRCSADRRVATVELAA